METGAITFGYTYASGSHHFAGMERVEVPGLEVERGDPLLVRTFGEEWTVPLKAERPR